MKKFIGGLLMIGLLSLVAAGLTWWIIGPPDRSIPCEQIELVKGDVCLKTVLTWEADSYLWVDARPRKLWKKNGVNGSVLFTDDKNEDEFELIEAFMNAVFRDGHIFPKVIVYCNESGCESSKSIAVKLRDEYGMNLGFEVYVLHGGWKALAAEELVRKSPLTR